MLMVSITKRNKMYCIFIVRGITMVTHNPKAKRKD